MPNYRLILIVGQEGVGKTSTLRALARQIPWSARIDGAELAAVNPWSLDETRLNLLWANVSALAKNYWDAGFYNFVAGSFFSNFDQYNAFRKHLNQNAETYVIQLCARKTTRDRRRIERSKPSSKEWRDHVDMVDPEDMTLAAADQFYRFLRIDNDDISIESSINRIRDWAPELIED